MLKYQIMVKYCIKLFQDHLNMFITRSIMFETMQKVSILMFTTWGLLPYKTA